jgi:hypothetical protein
MISYLINITAIWVVSLLAFDLLLRSDSGYVRNRIYLLSTLVLGLVLPMMHLPVQQVITRPELQVTMAHVNVARKAVAAAATPAPEQFSLLLVCSFIYLLGLALSIALLLREALVLANWYRLGRKEKRDGYTIVFTDKVHSPFSVLGLMFISSEQSYTSTELSFILSHEQRHIHSLHSWDKFFVLLLRSAFWFHPLVYVYYKRLMMVHEFEADAAAASSDEYGVFLIAQHLAGNSPGISHSFNHSPLKTRIRMLSTTKTQTWRKAAYAIALPAVAAFGMLWVNSTSAHKREKQGNIIIFDGNKIEMGAPMMNGKPAPSETLVLRPGEGSQGNRKVNPDHRVVPVVASPGAAASTSVTFSLSPVPVKMNGETIYESDELSQKVALKEPNKSMLSVLTNDTRSLLGQLPDGRYRFRILNLVVDKSGRVAYYDLEPIEWYTKPVPFSGSEDDMKLVEERKKEREAHKVNAELRGQIMAAFERSLDNMKFRPAMKDGKPVIAYTNEHSSLAEIEVIKVEHGKVSVVKQ